MDYTRVDNPLMTISDRLDEAMRDAKLSQAELGRISKVPQPTVNRILKGPQKRGPETATLVALANALRVEFLWLQQGTGPKHAGGRPAPVAVAVVEETPAELKLHWLTAEEADVLADFRSATKRGKTLIRSATKRAERQIVGRAIDES